MSKATTETDTQTSWQANFLPCSGGWLLLWFCLIWLVGAPQHFLSDGAVARHLTTGRDILERGFVPHTNYIWAIDPHYPWLTHELFGDIAIGGAYRLAGLKGVAALGIVVVGLALMWSFQMARNRGLGRITSWLIFVPVMLASSVHWLTRSHIFSYLFFLMIYYLTFMSRCSWKRRTLLSGLILCLWANFHGSVLIGLFMLAIKPLCNLAASAWKAGRINKTNVEAVEFAPLVAGIVGAALNVRGPDLYAYLVGYANHPAIMGKGGEWHVLDFSLPVGAWSFLIVAACLLLVFLATPKKPPLSETILCVALFGGAVYAMRLIPYFVLVALPTMGPLIATIRETALATGGGQQAVQSFLSAFWRADANQPQSNVSTAKQSLLRIALLVACIAVFILVPRFAIDDFPADKLPVKAVDFLQQQHIAGLGFYFDNWGPYVYYRLHEPIFIDDKTDFYPEAFLQDYWHAYESGQLNVLDKYNVAYVLVPVNSTLAKTLEHTATWRKAFEDRTAVVYLRVFPDLQSQH